MAFAISSPAFADHAPIPVQYTCEGADLSPPLSWSGAPPSTQSFVLVVDDPDAPDPQAPKMTWVHWVLYNIPKDAKELPADTVKHGLPAGTRSGLNDWRRAAYGGPCPPVGRHRYFHKLYALDTLLADLGRPTKAQLLTSIKGHVLAETQIVGTYQKQR
jgi:Raf kinase inhibitor-like YbhB/YbcL family protein